MSNTDEFLKHRHLKLSLDGPIQSIKKFKKSGNQGIVELVEINGKRTIVKVSQYIDFVARHEFNVMKGLNVLSSYCPHFCRAYELKEMNLGKQYENMPSIFYDSNSTNESNKIKMDVLFMEQIPSSLSLATGILDQSISKKQLFSCLKQVLIGLKIAQLKLNFTHYDLHTDNVLLLPVNKDSYSLYVFENDLFLLPTYGVLPIIIDFGFSYCDSLLGTNFYSTLEHTNRGYCPFMPDFFNDIKILMLNVVQDNIRTDNAYRLDRFESFIFKIFGKLAIDLESGWEDVDGPSLNANVAMEVIDLSKRLVNNRKHPFIEYPHFCVDILSTMISLPFKDNKGVKSTIRTPFTMFIKEFEKISTLKKYKTLKDLIDVSKKYKEDYEKNKPKVISMFTNELEQKVGKVNASTEKLLCSLSSLSKRMENNYLKNVKDLHSFKKEQNDILNSQKIYNILDLYYTIEQMYNPSSFTFKPGCKIYIWNTISKKNDSVLLTNTDISELQRMPCKDQASLLFKKYVK